MRLLWISRLLLPAVLPGTLGVRFFFLARPWPMPCRSATQRGGHELRKCWSHPLAFVAWADSVSRPAFSDARPRQTRVVARRSGHLARVAGTPQRARRGRASVRMGLFFEQFVSDEGGSDRPKRRASGRVDKDYDSVTRSHVKPVAELGVLDMGPEWSADELAHFVRCTFVPMLIWGGVLTLRTCSAQRTRRQVEARRGAAAPWTNAQDVRGSLPVPFHHARVGDAAR